MLGGGGGGGGPFGKQNTQLWWAFCNLNLFFSFLSLISRKDHKGNKKDQFLLGLLYGINKALIEQHKGGILTLGMPLSLGLGSFGFILHVFTYPVFISFVGLAYQGKKRILCLDSL